MTDLLDRLNQAQKEAVTLGWGPALVLAGAGSGKTTVLTRRVAYLISCLQQDPYSILAVTFTNKAASEMRNRLESLVGVDLVRRLMVGTFHSTCARLLRQEIANYRSEEGFTWGSNFVIYDETDSLNLVKAVIARLNLDDKAFPPREMRHAISELKNDGYASSHFSQKARSYRDNKLCEIYTAYQADLARNNALDFDDLILVFTNLLKQNPQCRQKLKERFRHILVDEFQDTNKSQYELISMLAPGRGDRGDTEHSLMVVGDVDQSIYSWRKADFRIILGFQKDFADAHLVKLEENYRSTETILSVANSVIVNNAERIEKVLRCNRGHGARVQCFAATDEIDEANCVVEEIKKLAARGRSYADNACLYRTNAQSRALEEVLVRNNIPYTMVGSTRFYERAEIKDVLAYLKLIYNQADGQSFLRIVNCPRRGLGKTTLERLSAYAQANGTGLVQAAYAADSVPDVSSKAARTLQEFAAMIGRWHTLAQTVSVAALIEVVLSETKYLKELEAEARTSRDPVVVGRIENVKELVVVAREFEALADEPDLESFLTRVSLLSDLDSANFNEDAVKLMTLHSAKGLEFPVVFLLGLEEKLFPHIRSLDLPSALEEERRLMYVGVTRAEDLLYLSYARRRMIFGGGSGSSMIYTTPSRFLSEINPELLLGYYGDPESNRLAGGRGQVSAGGSASKRPAIAFRAERGLWSYAASSDADASAGEAVSINDASRNGASRIDVSASHRDPDCGNVIPLHGRGRSAGADRSSNSGGDWERLATGDIVQHGTFGVGRVVQVLGQGSRELYNVEFEAAGKRLLDPRFARLIKLSPTKA